jgi:L-ascorbate metabolism protein UlaG (beta-lactamase superfamily)
VTPNQKTRGVPGGWIAHLWHEWLLELRRPIAPAPVRPKPEEWPNDRLTAAWLGHSTVLLNFFGVTVLTDPVLFPRIGPRLPFLTIGPKRLTNPALSFRELPAIDLVLLSHAHFDHLDTRTLHRFGKRTQVVTALRTRDLLRWTRLREITELCWGGVRTPGGRRQVRVPHGRQDGLRSTADMRL